MSGCTTNKKINEKRALFLDMVKVVAIFMVLYNHRYPYQIANTMTDVTVKGILIQSLATICRCGVPLFFMASGVVLLDKKETFLQLFKHRILRILIVMVICTIIRAWGDFSLGNLLTVFFSRLNWYLYAYLDYLLMLPLIKRNGWGCKGIWKVICPRCCGI